MASAVSLFHLQVQARHEKPSTNQLLVQGTMWESDILNGASSTSTSTINWLSPSNRRRYLLYLHIVLVCDDQSSLLGIVLYRSPVNTFKRLVIASSMSPDTITGITMSDQPTTGSLLLEVF